MWDEQAKLRKFYREHGICEKCGRNPIAKGHRSLCIKCRIRHNRSNAVGAKRQRIYRLIDSLFPMIYPKRKQKALEIMTNLKKKIKALSSCYRVHAD